MSLFIRAPDVEAQTLRISKMLRDSEMSDIVLLRISVDRPDAVARLISEVNEAIASIVNKYAGAVFLGTSTLAQLYGPQALKISDETPTFAIAANREIYTADDVEDPMKSELFDPLVSPEGKNVAFDPH